jgi:hypothetical protein
MESTESKTANRIDLRVVQSPGTPPDAWMTVTNEGHVIRVPVRTQLGAPIKAIVNDKTITLREGRLFIHDGGQSAAKVSKKPSFGLVQYHASVDVEREGQEQFEVRLYVPTKEYGVIWDLAARGRLPRQISLQVKGLQGDSEWDVSDVGTMLLIEDFSFSFPISA